MREFHIIYLLCLSDIKKWKKIANDVILYIKNQRIWIHKRIISCRISNGHCPNQIQDHHKHLYMANQEYHKPFFYSRMIIINQNMQDYHKHLYKANQEYHKPFFYTRMIIIIHFRRIIINLERHWRSRLYRISLINVLP